MVWDESKHPRDGDGRFSENPHERDEKKRDAVRHIYDSDVVAPITNENEYVADDKHDEDNEAEIFHEGAKVNEFFYNDPEYQKWKESISPITDLYIGWYTGIHPEKINGYLRGKNPPGKFTVDEIRAIDSAINSFVLKRNIIVHRGVRLDDLDEILNTENVKDNIEKVVGTIYTERGYSSSTVLYGNSVATTKGAVFEFFIPKGKGRGAYINEFSGDFEDSEYEFLIKRGASFKIKSAWIDENGKIWIKGEMISDEK